MTVEVPCLSVTLTLFAQSTVGTGNIVGTVNDPSGAVVSGAVVTIANVATGQIVHLTTNSLGSYNSGALVPGDYRVRVSAQRFSSVEVSLTVLVGNTATANVSLQLGPETQVIVVQGSALRVNTEQPTVQGVLSAQAFFCPRLHSFRKWGGGKQ
jgi:Carboxypeptidase regulatory-like domain